LGGNAHLAVGARSAAALRDFGVIYGLPVIGFALLWAVFAATVTVRTARKGLPFSLTWWSFTFPVGTCVTGLTALSVRTGSTPLRDTADAAYVVLLGAWLVVAARTLTSQRAAVRRLR
jgi:tellurite resistance protein TehA-like permease